MNGKEIKKIKRPLSNKFILNMVMLILIITIVIFIFLFYFDNNEKEILAFSLLSKVTNEVEEEFKNLLLPITRNLVVIQKWGEYGLLDKMDTYSLNSSFMPILLMIPHISELMIVDEKGIKYILIRNEKTWVTGSINKNMLYAWQRWKNPEELIAEWESEIKYSPKILAWYSHALKVYKNNYFVWMNPGIDLKTNKTISTALIIWKSKNNNKRSLVAINVSLNKVIRAIRDKYFNTGGNVFIIDGESNLIAFPLLDKDSKESIFQKENKTAALNAIKIWKRNKQIKSFRFTSNNSVYIGKFRPLKKGNKKSLLIGVVAAEDKILAEIKKETNIYIYITISIIIIGMLLVVFIIQTKKIKKDIDLTDKTDLSEKGIFTMIKNGESENLELKSSLRWHFYKNVVDKKVEEIIMKSLAAFYNGEGGFLLIGVNDNGEILGLEKDLNTLKGNNKDQFELHLRNLINNYYGIEFATRHIKIYFPEISGKEICLIEIKKGTKPLYTRITDKNGFKVEKFFVRSGNSSRELNKPSEIADYLKTRFK